MEQKDMQKVFKSLEKKLGKEDYSKIADDLGTILTDNETMNNTISSKDEEIDTLKKNNELLITANGNLLQQVGMGEDTSKNKNEDDDLSKGQPKISLKSAFDEKGNFIN